MSNRRKLSQPRPALPAKPRFPLENLPPWLAETVRAVAAAEHVTIDQAGMAALFILDRAIGDKATLTGPDGEVIETAPLDMDFLVPDPADRPGVRKAHNRLLAELPPDARAALGDLL